MDGPLVLLEWLYNFVFAQGLKMKFYLVKMCPIFVGYTLSCFEKGNKNSFEDDHLDVKIN